MQASAGTRALTLSSGENLELERGNIYQTWQGSPDNFPKQWIGYDDDHLLYTFFQESGDHPQGWSGIETFLRPPSGVPVAQGYGALPIRVWGREFLAESDGSIAASQGFLAPRVYLANPVYTPYGGIYGADMAHDAYIERAGNGDLRFVSPQVPGGLSLSELAGGPPSPPGGSNILPLLAMVGLLAVAAVAASHGVNKKFVFKS